MKYPFYLLKDEIPDSDLSRNHCQGEVRTEIHTNNKVSQPSVSLQGKD